MRRTVSPASRKSTSPNVADLKVAFTWAIGDIQGGGTAPVVFPFSGLEGTPIAEDGFLYLTSGWGVVTKLDVRGGKPVLMWKYDPEADKDWAPSVTCCGINNRGVALHTDKVLGTVIDGRVFALNKNDGSLLWETQAADPGIAEVITNAPLIVKDMVLTGMAGAEFGVRGWIAALDVKHRQGNLAHAHDSRAGRAGSRNLEGRLRRLENRRRLHLGNGLL